MSKQDEKKLYEQQEEKILAQSDAFISLLTKRGILADQKIDSEKVRSAKQEKTKNSYHNTLMLPSVDCLWQTAFHVYRGAVPGNGPDDKRKRRTCAHCGQ